MASEPNAALAGCTLLPVIPMFPGGQPAAPSCEIFHRDVRQADRQTYLLSSTQYGNMARNTDLQIMCMYSANLAFTEAKQPTRTYKGQEKALQIFRAMPACTVCTCTEFAARTSQYP